MTDSHIFSFNSDDYDDDSGASKSQETNPGGQKEIEWKVVAETPGITPATILAGRLRAEGILVRIWQEGAGQALGLTVGALGTGYVAVPAEDETTARTILETDESDLLDDWDEEDE